MLSQTTTKRLMLARYFFGLAQDAAKSHREVGAFAAINMLQDAVEIFFLAAADHLNADIGRRTEFDQYIDKINDKLSAPLPFRQRLMEVNKVRVLSKHNGVPPNPTELRGYFVDAKQCFEEGSQTVFNRPFWAVSLIDLLPDGEPRLYVMEAEKAFHAGKYQECLIECRKAIYVEIERDYVIDSFQDDWNVLFKAMCKAPYHTRNKQFIDEYVTDPFDYVRLDHNRVDAELLRDGIEPGVFWNIWRLTPSVYRHIVGETWMVKLELQKHFQETLEQSASYVLENTIDVLLKKARTRSSFLSTEVDTNFFGNPKNGKPFMVYLKADRQSQIVGEVPGVTGFLSLVYRTPGLKEGIFWRVSYVGDLEQGVGPGVGTSFDGYADENDLDLGG